MPKKVGKKKAQQSKEAGQSVSRQTLLNVLSKARAGVDVKGITGIEQAQHFIFQGSRVFAYNDRVAISAPLGIDTGLEVSVQAETLHRVLKDISESEVGLSLDDEDGSAVVTVASNTTTAGIAAEEVVEGGELHEVLTGLALDSLKKKDWQDLPEGFLNAIGLCGVSVSKDTANVAFSSLRVCSDRILSTDNWRISRYTFDEEVAAMDFLLPYDSARELAKHRIVQFQQHGSWAYFRDEEGLVFAARTVDVEFPNCDKFLELEGSRMTLPVGLAEALKASLVMAAGEDEELREAELRFRKGGVEVWAQNDNGWIKKSVPVSGMKVPKGLTKLSINPVFFIDILQRATTMTVGSGRALFSSGPFEHIMNLPMDEEE